MDNKVNEIMKKLDEWVSNHGPIPYSLGNEESASGNHGKYNLPLVPGIQQVREEIEEFVSLLVKLNISESALEIGFGYYGSTHFLWRLIFDRVISIEKNHDRIRTFGSNLNKFYGKWVLNDMRSSFLIGLSHETSTVSKVYELESYGTINLLFIDGDHNYANILSEWLLYNHLVKKGGIVAFHDILFDYGDQGGVPIIVSKLKNGEIGGVKRNIQTIEHSQTCGIAYYIQE